MSGDDDWQSQRLDIHLVAVGLARSRSQAGDLVRRGAVSVDGIAVKKPAFSVRAGMDVSVDLRAAAHVSRGGEKLAHALDHYAIDPAAKNCLDVGASTGGFTDVLLRRGATHVVAVDVGHNQLHRQLAADSRVVSLEDTDARRLTRAQVQMEIHLIVADVSFISLTLALPVPMSLAAPQADLVALIKPQFELTPTDIGKGGIVTSEAARLRAVERVTGFLDDMPGWKCREPIPSPITGGSGNVEFLIAAHRESG